MKIKKTSLERVIIANLRNAQKSEAVRAGVKHSFMGDFAEKATKWLDCNSSLVMASA